MAGSTRSASATACSTAPSRSPRSSAPSRQTSSTTSAPASTTRPGTSTCALNGRKIGKDELIAAFERHPVYSQQEKVRIDVLKRFGVYSTESNGHLSRIPALVPQAAGRDHQAGSTCRDWIHGETGGYLRYSTETPQLVRDGFPAIPRRCGRSRSTRRKRTNEHASHIIEALETGRVYRGHFNVSNNGIITNLPADAIIEIARLRRPLRHQHGRGHHAAGRPAPRPASPRSTCSACRSRRR